MTTADQKSEIRRGVEHRNGERVRARIKVLLLRDGLPVFSGISRNIGAGGLFLEMPITQLCSVNRVELDVCFDDDGQVNHYHLLAMVSHKHNDGVGLMFLTANKELLRRARLSMQEFEVITPQKQGRTL
jgi:hypothetical protein